MTDYPEDIRTSVGSLKAVAGIVIDDWTGLLDVDVFRGDPKLIPGMPGRLGVELVRDAYDFSVPFSLSGSTPAELYDRIASLRALFPTTKLTLIRRLSAALTPFYVDKTCNGLYRGLTWTNSHPTDRDGVLSFTNLDGAWA